MKCKKCKKLLKEHKNDGAHFFTCYSCQTTGKYDEVMIERVEDLERELGKAQDQLLFAVHDLTMLHGKLFSRRVYQAMTHRMAMLERQNNDIAEKYLLALDKIEEIKKAYLEVTNRNQFLELERGDLVTALNEKG